jgi:hypothetical protein
MFHNMSNRRTLEPPFLLDGTHVVRYALIDASKPPPSHFSVVANGVPLDLDVVRGLIIAEDLVNDGVYLMHCNEEWQTLAAEGFTDADAAQASAESRYAAVPAAWHRYRPLSESERREVDVTREFLREIAAEFPDD